MKCRIELPKAQVSDTRDGDSSNTVYKQIKKRGDCFGLTILKLKISFIGRPRKCYLN
jgi:hypothetical protein